jgi:hypothetical protein
MKAVDLLVEHAVPEEFREALMSSDYGSKQVNQVLAAVALKYPDKLAEVTHALASIGRNASYTEGESFGLDDLEDVIDKKKVFTAMDREIAAAGKELGVHTPEYRQAREAIWLRYSGEIEKATQAAGVQRLNSMALSVASGARGKPQQLNALISTPGVYQDNNGRTIPMFIRRSYAEGLRPAEFMAGTFGARQSVTGSKIAVARGGDLLKQFVQNTDRLVVTEKDCGTANGIDLDIGDQSLVGRVLAEDQGGYPAGTPVDTRVANDLKRAGSKFVVTRSALTCQAKEGLCAKCLGRKSGGGGYRVGDSVGAEAATTAGEPIVQGALNCLRVGTLVRMADMTIKSIEDIKIGEWVLGADVMGNTFPVRVLANWDQGLQPVSRFTYTKGMTRREIQLEATVCHPVLSNKKNYGKDRSGKTWHSKSHNTAVKLPAGYRHKNLSAVLPVTCELKKTAKEAYAELCGVLLGDGIRWSLSNRNATPRFSCADPTLVEYLNTLLAAEGIQVKKMKRSFDWAFCYGTSTGFSNRDSVTGRMAAKPVSSHLIKRKIIEWGLEDQYAHTKKVPKQVLTWDTRAVLGLLAGYIATDGSVGVSKKGQIFISFSSCSRALVDGLQTLLETRLCVYSTNITKVASKGEKNHVHDQWQFTVTAKDQVLKFVKLCEHYGVKIPGIKEGKLETLLSTSTKIPLNRDPFFKARRKRIDYLGIFACRDLSVDHPDELFVLANGLIVKNTKHVAGMASAKKDISGLRYIEQFAQSPEEFLDRAAVAEEDGTVSAITEAPQGGTYITVGSTQQYVPPGTLVSVKVGDAVEAGDQLSDGLVDPEDIIRLRGIGEGRRYYADRLTQLLKDSGVATDRRNVETLARGHVDHVRVDDPEGLSEYLPDDIASYSRLATRWTPPESTMKFKPDAAVGKYLQTPVLHYTIGTRVTPKIAKHLKDRGRAEVYASEEAPGFVPEMQRLRTAGHNQDEDFIAGMTGSYLKAHVQDSVIRGKDANPESNVHYAGPLSRGTDFGKTVRTTGKF